MRLCLVSPARAVNVSLYYMIAMHTVRHDQVLTPIEVVNTFPWLLYGKFRSIIGADKEKELMIPQCNKNKYSTKNSLDRWLSERERNNPFAKWYRLGYHSLYAHSFDLSLSSIMGKGVGGEWAVVQWSSPTGPGFWPGSGFRGGPGHLWGKNDPDF